MEDMDSILREWPFEQGIVQARVIRGSDGRPKLQLRLDLGILQMEIRGRPDGQRPFGHESLLKHYQSVAGKFEKEGKGDSFKLTSEDCMKLHQEGVQYYHRYLAFFQLQNFEAVIRDTKRNLVLFDFVTRYAEKPELSIVFQQFRAYVLMMLARAQGMHAIQNKDYPLAVQHAEHGIQEIQKFAQEALPPEFLEQSAELQFLQNWVKELREQRPLTPREKLQRQMADAISREDYERAARLRDALRAL